MVLNESVLEGSEGAMRLRVDGSIEWEGLRGERISLPVALPSDDEVYVDGYAATQSHFVEGLRTGRRHETDGLDALKTMEVVWASYRSAREGRKMDLLHPENGTLDPNSASRRPRCDDRIHE